MKLSETLYTQLTDRQMSIDKRLDLTEQYWHVDSKQMIFDWLSGLVINRKKSGLDSVELVHRVWRQLVFCLQNLSKDQISIKSSFIKALTDTLDNESGESNHSAVECCLLIGKQGKELDYKYEQLVELLRIVLNKYKEHEEFLTMILNKYWTTVRVQGNINKRLALWTLNPATPVQIWRSALWTLNPATPVQIWRLALWTLNPATPVQIWRLALWTLNPATPVQIWVFLDLCKQLLAPLLDIRRIYPSLSVLIDDILKYIVFHRTWSTAYRDYIQSLSTNKTISCPVSILFTTIESLVISGNSNVINFLPLVFRHCINLIDSEKTSEVFELLSQMNHWLEQISNDNLYIDGIRQLLEILDEKHLIDQLLNDTLTERITNWMKDILFKRQIPSKSENYARLCIVCLHLHPTLIETNLSELIKDFLDSKQSLTVFLNGYIDLYAHMRSLAKLPKRLTMAFDQSVLLPSNVTTHYRKRISECTHTLIDEIWSSLLDQLENGKKHLIIIQLIGALLDGYRLFDLNIPRATLIQQTQSKYDRTLEKLRQQVNENMLTSPDPSYRICLLQCYLSLGWFSLCLLSFSSTTPPVDDILNHNGLLLSHSQWAALQTDSDLHSILFSLACQRLYRSLAVDEKTIDPSLVDNLIDLSSFSSTTVFDQLEPFFDFLSKSKQMKLIKLFIKQIIDHPNQNRAWFITDESRLRLVVQAMIEHVIETNAHDDSQARKRRKIDWEEHNDDSFYDFLSTKSCTIDGKILSIFSSINFDVIQTPTILISIGWLALKTSPASLESMQILLDIIRSTKVLPISFISHLLDFTLTTNNEQMIDGVLTILSTNLTYQSIVKTKANAIIEKMKSEEDFQNIRLLEKHLLLFHHSRKLISSNDLCIVIDRLLNSSSPSSISYSTLDTRYVLAIIILNGLTSYEKYLKFLQQTWKSLIRDMNESNQFKQVVIAYVKQWEHVLKSQSTIEDIDALVKCLNDRHELISKVIQSMELTQFQQWIENSIQHIKIPLNDHEDDIQNCHQALLLLQTLARCSLSKELNAYLMTIIDSVITQCGPLLIHLPHEFSRYSQVVSFVLTFSNDIVAAKKSQLRSQVALSLLQCCLHLPPNIFFVNHSNICKLVSLLIKHHTVTLCKHVPTIETILKLLLQSIVSQAKENQATNEELIEAARDMTKLSAHLIEQCKEDFRSTIVYVLIDYVHLLSKGVYISTGLKKTLNGVAFELFRISGERVEQYSGQMSIGERELLKQLHQQFKQYHMFKGAV
ncbi:unnamed protein product [Adineta ricciae]|uniref:Nucleolar 27S pre-rRNA processing Urb2/Npa2 C-terminal domain-containing protein n=1 Tax=Adineta ricciae TaxID=249248 RepID=A0A814QL98_ADIRI|nr:unnamed protein product [Adineta ricciae]